jgi:hypothetical protein
MSQITEYECAISGITTEATLEHEKDGLGTLPPGWTRLTVERREVNMKWVAIRDLKIAMVENILKQYPEEQREIQRLAITLQVEAQLAALESITPPYVSSKEVVYLAPRDANSAIKEVIDDLRENLGLESLMYEDDDEDETEPEAAPEAVAAPRVEDKTEAKAPSKPGPKKKA